MKYCFGVDIGGTFVKLGLFTTDGELLDKWQIPTRREDNSSHVLPDIAAAIAAKLEEKGISKDDVTGVGFGTPGPVTEDGVAVCPANLDWVNKPVAKELTELMVGQAVDLSIHRTEPKDNGPLLDVHHLIGAHV